MGASAALGVRQGWSFILGDVWLNDGPTGLPRGCLFAICSEMARYVDGIRVATCVFEAAARHETVRVRCGCGHKALHDPHGLWWLCQRRGWDDGFRALVWRFYCTRCLAALARKVRPAAIDTCRADATIWLPMPPEREWKRAIRR